ncbi:MAG: hypothetical protein MUE98_05520 [Rhodobacteraceae bacterium]|jgi:hypothetical protein|nr:hypothetical protein [Paracoccaceae bacterium]
MDDDWILDVIADLKTFAEANDLPFLAVSLNDALRVAEIELASRLAQDPALRERGAGASRPIAIYVRRGRGSSGPHDA